MGKTGKGRGITLPELMVAVACVSLVLLAAGARLLSQQAVEPVELLDKLHTMLQLARLEAVSRDVVCRLEVDQRASHVAVWDSLGTPDRRDDLLLYRVRVPEEARLLWVRADEEPVPLPKFEILFDPAGRVLEGAGEVLVLGTPRSGSVEVRADGELVVADATS